MPQLNISTYISQIFWLTVSFLSLWFVMSWFIIPRIRQIIEERERKIETYIQKAETINKQALETLERYEKSLARAKLQANEQISAEKAQTETDIEQKKAELDALLNSKISQNAEILKKERLEMLNAVDKISEKTATLILEKLGLTVDKDSKDA